MLSLRKQTAKLSTALLGFYPKSVVKACLDFGFLEEWIVWLLMSNSELLRIKNKQKTTYKNQKTASSYKKYRKRPNDRFGVIAF